MSHSVLALHCHHNCHVNKTAQTCSKWLDTVASALHSAHDVMGEKRNLIFMECTFLYCCAEYDGCFP